MVICMWMAKKLSDYIYIQETNKSCSLWYFLLSCTLIYHVTLHFPSSYTLVIYMDTVVSTFTLVMYATNSIL